MMIEIPTHTLPNGQTIPGPWLTVEEVQHQHRYREVDWFAANDFFRTRIESGITAGRLFVTSEQFVASDGTADPRRFTVRCVSDTGGISTIGPFNRLTRKQADVLVADLVAPLQKALAEQRCR